MIQLYEGDSRVVNIIRKKELNQDLEYRLSSWVFRMEKDGRIALRNCLSKQAYQLSQQEWDAVQSGDYSCPAVEELAKVRFLVENDFDDLAQYNMVLNALRSMSRKGRGTATFVILPTTGCNARCVYCYQEGIESRNMSLQTAERVVDFICEQKREGSIELHWFGGEPLCAPKVISHICRGLTERKVEYTSFIVSNGSLFTPSLIREAVELWHLRRAQISMDGAREDYDSRKRYIRPDLYHYDLVMDNVRLLAEAEVKVTIRCNCDSASIPRAYRFVDECVQQFGADGNVRLAPSLLNTEERKHSIEEYEAFYNLKGYAEKRGFPQRKVLAGKFKTHQCMADSEGATVLIDPDGGLHFCEDRVGEPYKGTIFDSALPVPPLSPIEPEKECRECCFLPDCTTFYRRNCPICPMNCRELIELSATRELGTLLAYASAEQSAEIDDSELCD